MSKQNILDKGAQHSSQTMQQQDLSNVSVTVQLQHAIEQEKVRRVSRSRPLEVLQYEPGLSNQARHFVEGWHLLFFARSGSTHMQELRAALQQENERDLHLLSYVQKVQAQYREYMARYAQSYRESVQEQAVIAEIRYGGLSLIPAFWLPEEMELGLSLLPRTGAQLPTDALTLVEHAQSAASGSLDVLLVTATPIRTKAELAAPLSAALDPQFLTEERLIPTLTPLAFAAGAIVGFVAGIGTDALMAGISVVAVAAVAANPPEPPPSEDMIQRQALRVRELLRTTPSASQLIEARQHLFVGDKTQ